MLEPVRSAGQRTCVASYESERACSRSEEFDHFSSYNAACTQDGDHLRCSPLKQERWGLPNRSA
jgi:hypothetical protein